MGLSEREENISKFLKSIGFKAENAKLFDVALTHSSYTHENNISRLENYERLEFLGDAVLKLISSTFLYEKYPEKNEGELSKIRSILVSDAVIEDFSRKINLGSYIKFGDHEKGENNPTILACAFESLLGALYLHFGLEKTGKFLLGICEEKIYEIEKNTEIYNAKAVLQEFLQTKSTELPKYVLKSEAGKAHDKTFEIEVFYDNNLLGEGSGKSKKEAEQKAAMQACLKLGIIKK